MSRFKLGQAASVYHDPLTERDRETDRAIVKRCYSGDLGVFLGRKLRRYVVDLPALGPVERNILDPLHRDGQKPRSP